MKVGIIIAMRLKKNLIIGHFPENRVQGVEGARGQVKKNSEPPFPRIIKQITYNSIAKLI